MSVGRVAVLYTGGKDSTYAIEKLKEANFKVTCLVSVISENPYSYMLHTPNIKTTELSATALDIPIVYGRTKGEKEKELSDIRDSINEARRRYPFEFLGSGGLCSEYQKSRLEKIAREIGLTPLSPLWGIDQRRYMRNLVKKRYRFILTAVSSAGLDEKWLGRTIDEESIKQLESLSDKYHFNPAFEGGEAETFVLDCPLFRKSRLEIVECESEWDGSSGRLTINEARLVDKNAERAENVAATAPG